MAGYIYQASNYDYIGRQICNSFFYIPDRGLIHVIAAWHRWKAVNGSDNTNLRRLRPVFGEVWRWCGYNFRYLYYLGPKRERAAWLERANFEIVDKYPGEQDLEIWLENEHGERREITPAFARTVPIVRLPTKRGRDKLGGAVEA